MIKKKKINKLDINVIWLFYTSRAKPAKEPEVI